MQSELFADWLIKTGIGQSSVTKYSVTGIRKAEFILREIGSLREGSLDNIQDVSEIAARFEVLRKQPEWIEKKSVGHGMYEAAINHYLKFRTNLTPTDNVSDSVPLPKPFILLAGISGTGKSRFVREQAKRWSSHYPSNFELVSVRPDWHEPSDLLGYISRLNQTKYVSTPVLKFIAQAWVATVQRADENGFTLKDLTGIPPSWLCLDEMNLAPVEQYFADYLSVLETRKWEGEVYSCDPLLKADVFSKLGEAASKDFLKELLGDDYATNSVKNGLATNWLKNGISIPPNLIVAGTVNMDETTHGFSRKVIDRALTLDFQEFFPNDFNAFFGGQLEPKTFSFPTVSDAWQLADKFGDADADGAKTRAFLSALNTILTGTPFQLAFRALNEALLSVYCFKPADDNELQAVWDDFLMQKVLPRIEGDGSKLKSDFVWPKEANPKLVQEFGKGTLLHKLYLKLQEDDLLGKIWTAGRPDLLRENAGTIECRSKKKLEWMMRRLKNTHFTDFWV